MLESRYAEYKAWSKANLKHGSETEIWTRWMCPELPPTRVHPVADRLTLAWIERGGKAVLLPDVAGTLRTLRERQYRLGLISNSVSTLDIPAFLKANAIDGLFEGLFCSSEFGTKKPDPVLFVTAAGGMSVKPVQCAYVGNRLSKDILGCKRAGFSLGVLVRNPIDAKPEIETGGIQPDRVLDSFSQLLEIFP